VEEWKVGGDALSGQAFAGIAIVVAVQFMDVASALRDAIIKTGLGLRVGAEVRTIIEIA
jgi:hypothetical protein